MGLNVVTGNLSTEDCHVAAVPRKVCPHTFSKYLSFAQSNGDAVVCEQHSQGGGQARGERRGAVEDHLHELPGGAVVEEAADLPDIADEPQEAIAREGRTARREPLARPEEDIVRQCPQEREHLLGLEPALVALGQAQALLVPLVRRLAAPAA